jgi:hypothetical protein
MLVMENACAIYGAPGAAFCYLWMALVSSFGCVSCAKRVSIVEHETGAIEQVCWKYMFNP